MTITFFNQKGGVGKTTCSVLLIDYLLSQGKRVLAIDLDPQGSLSEVFLIGDPSYTLLDFFQNNQTLKGCITPISEKLDLLVSHRELRELPLLDSVVLNRKKINFLPVLKEYDYVIIDSKPDLHWLPRLGVILADYIIMPNAMSKLSYDALKDAMTEIDLYKTSDLKRVVAFENMGKKRNAILKENYRDLFKRDLGEDFLDIKLIHSISIDERSAQDINYFESDMPNKKDVQSFFKGLMEALNG